MNHNPVEIIITDNLLRRHQPAKFPGEKGKETTEETSQHSKESKDDKKDKLPGISRVNNLFVIPPVHVYQLLRSDPRTFMNVDNLENWITNTALSGTDSSLKELETKGTITGYNAFWIHLQNWIHGTASLISHQQSYCMTILIDDQSVVDNYILTHTPQVLWTFHENKTPEPSDTPFDDDAVIVGNAVRELGKKTSQRDIGKTNSITGQSKDGTTESKTNKDDDQEDNSDNVTEQEVDDNSVDEEEDEFIPEPVPQERPAKQGKRSSKTKHTTSAKRAKTSKQTKGNRGSGGPKDDDSSKESITSNADETSSHRAHQDSSVNPGPDPYQNVAGDDFWSKFLMLQAQTLQQMQANSERSDRQIREIMRVNSETLAQLTSARIATESVEQTSSKDSSTLWTKLLDTQQLALTRGCATREGEEPETPIPTTVELYAHKQKALAKTYLENKMANLKAKYHPAVMANLVWNGPLWQTNTEPERLTIFAFHPIEEQFAANKKTSMYASLQSDYEIKVDKEDIQQLYHQDFYFPYDTYIFLHMLESYADLLGILFGTNSFVATRIKEFADAAIHRYSDFRRLASQSSQTLSKILYALDVAVQTFLRKLGDPQRLFQRSAFTNFTMAISTIDVNLEQQTFINTVLPAAFTTLMKEFLEKHSPENAKGKKKGNKNQNGNEETTSQAGQSRINQDINPKWKLPDGVTYQAAFYHESTKNKCPRVNGTAICLKYFVLGKCKAKCQFHHEDPRKNPEIEKLFNEYIQKAFTVGKQATQAVVSPATTQA